MSNPISDPTPDPTPGPVPGTARGSPPGSPPRPAAGALAAFILDNLGPLRDGWESFARTIPAAALLSSPALRDHAHGILLSIAQDLAKTQTGQQQHAKSVGLGEPSPLDDMAQRHGRARMADGFTISDAISEYRALRAGVLRRWAEAGADGNPTVHDMTRFNEAIDQALAQSLSRYTEARDRQYQLFDTLLSSSPDLNFIVDTGGGLIYANRAFANMFGLPPSRLHGVGAFELLAPYAPDMAQHVAEVMRCQRPYRGELKVNIGRRGSVVYEYMLVPALDCDQHCTAVAGSARDVTDRKASEERHRYSANFDHLTKLPNRNMFRESLTREMKHALRTERALGLLFIDLDGFKKVNDTLGHEAGDQLLKQVARRISARVRETDTVARLGGDEFTVILTDVTQVDAVKHLAAGLLCELAQPFRLAAGEARISASVGIGLFPDHARTCDELVRNADAAMYAAKNAGRNCFRFYDEVRPGAQGVTPPAPPPVPSPSPPPPPGPGQAA